MSVTLEIQQVIEEDDGTFTVIISALRDNGDVLISGKTFQCANAEELKAAVLPQFEKLVAIEKRRETIRAVAQSAIDEILNEVIQ